jgi:hypothetical protein
MTLKKFKPLVAFLMLVLIFAGYLAAPPSTEGIWVFGYMIDLLCDACRGNWRMCCTDLCYKDMAEGYHTDNINMAAYQQCIDDCVVGMAGMCRYY